MELSARHIEALRKIAGAGDEGLPEFIGKRPSVSRALIPRLLGIDRNGQSKPGVVPLITQRRSNPDPTFCWSAAIWTITAAGHARLVGAP